MENEYFAYGKVKYEEVYPGIDVIYYGKETNWNMTLSSLQRANPQIIQLNLQGSKGLPLTKQATHN
jgi:hypothetical protein